MILFFAATVVPCSSRVYFPGVSHDSVAPSQLPQPVALNVPERIVTRINGLTTYLWTLVVDQPVVIPSDRFPESAKKLVHPFVPGHGNKKSAVLLATAVSLALIYLNVSYLTSLRVSKCVLLSWMRLAEREPSRPFPRTRRG